MLSIRTFPTLIMAAVITGCSTSGDIGAPVSSATPSPAPYALTTGPANNPVEYKKLIAQRIAKSPDAAFAGGAPDGDKPKLLAVVGINIDAAGKLKRLWIVRSSGQQALDDKVLAAVRNASPFPAPSEGARAGYIDVTFAETFVFLPDGRFQLMSYIVAP